MVPVVPVVPWSRVSSLLVRARPLSSLSLEPFTLLQTPTASIDNICIASHTALQTFHLLPQTRAPNLELAALLTLTRPPAS